jgi:hypothetical protein
MYIKNKFWFGGKHTFLQVNYIYIAISTLKGIFPRFIDGIIKKRLFFCSSVVMAGSVNGKTMILNEFYSDKEPKSR